MLNDLSIDRARIADREAVVALLAAQMSEHRVGSECSRLLEVFDNILSDQRWGFILLARLGTDIVGVAYVAIILSIEHGAPVGWLEELYVRPGQRDLGIGSALLSAAINSAREAGVAALDLEVDADHRRAEALYERFGFQRLPRSRWVKVIRW